MNLGALVKGRQQPATRIILYGPEGVGKSTFAAGAPGAIFIGTEGGTSQLDVTRFPAPEAWGDVLEAVRVLTNETHDFKTLVIDTLDWAEPLLWEFICRRDIMKSIEDYGYGKGYQVALDEWRIFLAAIETMRRAKPSMHVIMLAHSWVKSFKNPAGPDYDRFEMKLNAKAAGLLKEWSDAVLFAMYETSTAKDEKKRIRGVDNAGARIVYTERRAAYDAKNRYSLPGKMPLGWSDFMAAVEAHQPADPAALTDEINRKAKQAGGQMEKDTLASLGRCGTDATKLSLLNNWITAQLAARAEE